METLVITYMYPFGIFYLQMNLVNGVQVGIIGLNVLQNRYKTLTDIWKLMKYGYYNQFYL